jgi:histidinol-phosphatase (PHP family)
MIATYHNHSTWSDGRTSIGEMVAGARRLGVDELGISDHFVVHPDVASPQWGMPIERLDEYVKEVLSFRDTPDLTIRLGLEVDWFPNHAAAIREALGDHPYDYLIGSVHEIDGFPIDCAAEHWEQLTETERNEMHRAYWRRITSLAQSGLFDIAAHLDLPKKFGYRATIDLSREIGAALDAIAASGMVVELNTAGWHKPVGEGYPSPDILRVCAALNIPVTLSADAHEPDHLLRDFERGAQWLLEAGYRELARFNGRKRTFEPIEAAVTTT